MEQNGHKGEFLAVSSLATLHDSDSRRIADKLFELLIHPTSLEEFYSSYHEQRPLLIKRNNSVYYDEWMKLKDLELLVKQGLEWNFEIDATRYTNGKRTTHNEEGIANPADVWGKYADGCSIRLPRPHRRLNHLCKATSKSDDIIYVTSFRQMLSLLDEHFGSSAGANVYLTPAGTQADRIACLDVYAPRNEYEAMPRYSSRNMTECKDEIGEPILECTLEAGDLLYFPRGFIHQVTDVVLTCTDAARVSGKKLKRHALTSRNSITWIQKFLVRRHQNPNQKIRQKFAKQAIALASKVTKYLEERCVDHAADVRALSFIQDRLPPIIPDANAKLGNPDEEIDEQLASAREAEAERVSLKTQFRLIRHNIARVKLEGDLAVLVHSVDNSRDFHGKEEQGIEFDVEYADALNSIIRSYPAYTRVKVKN
eukprot:487560-Hanusia_phi.AAC.1